MITTIRHSGKLLKADLSKPVDISIPLHAGSKNVNAFHMSGLVLEPFQVGDFIGSVKQGGSCNVNNISFNPHGNGTHTECVGHISRKFISLNRSLTEFFFLAKLITVKPEKSNGDDVITASQVSGHFKGKSKYPKPEALVIRTIPNSTGKKTRQYSGTNPPYLHAEASLFIREQGIKHLLLDLPSVDREMDGGKLSAHHAFWNYPRKTRTDATITELIYVPDKIKDGYYLLNLMIASFENDASPSKPVLYKLL